MLVATCDAVVRAVVGSDAYASTTAWQPEVHTKAMAMPAGPILPRQCRLSILLVFTATFYPSALATARPVTFRPLLQSTHA